MNKTGIREVRSSKAPEPVGPYSSAVRAGEMLFVSGQLGIDPTSGELKDGIGLQAEQALENLREIIGAAGAGMDRVVKVTLYLASMSDFAEVNRIYAGYFDAPYPARAAFEVARLPLDALVEIEAIALLEEERS